MKQKLANIYNLGIKELWSLIRDPVMLVLIAYSFTFSVYISATAASEGLQNAAIAIVDEDQSSVSHRLASAFYPPQFLIPEMIELEAIDPHLDRGDYTFVLNIPPNFQQDLLAGRSPSLQLNVDATRMSQAFTGGGTVQQIASGEIREYLEGYRHESELPITINERMRFNPNLTSSWFGGLIQVVDAITMLSIILTGAALIRERERGTIEHLLVMPVTPAEIMLAKIWAMGLVVLVAAIVSLLFVVQKLLAVPVAGSRTLFFSVAIIHLFAMNSMGIFLATIARNMPQFGMLMVIVLLPLQMLSGGSTPRESMPDLVQNIMLAAPTTHFIQMGQAILFRGAGLSIIWPSILFLLLIGGVFYTYSYRRFRATIGAMA